MQAVRLFRRLPFRFVQYLELYIMITLEEIQNRIAEAITQSGMSQSEIAEKLGICHQAVSAYMTCRNMPALDTLANLCKLLDIDANYILCQ